MTPQQSPCSPPPSPSRGGHVGQSAELIILARCCSGHHLLPLCFLFRGSLSLFPFFVFHIRNMLSLRPINLSNEHFTRQRIHDISPLSPFSSTSLSKSRLSYEKHATTLTKPALLGLENTHLSQPVLRWFRVSELASGNELGSFAKVDVDCHCLRTWGKEGIFQSFRGVKSGVGLYLKLR